MSLKSWASSRSANFLAFFEFLVELDFGLFEDLDAGAVQLRQEIVELAAARVVFGEKLVDLVVEDVALLFPGVHELLQPAEFFFDCHATPVDLAPPTAPL